MLLFVLHVVVLCLFVLCVFFIVVNMYRAVCMFMFYFLCVSSCLLLVVFSICFLKACVLRLFMYV